MPCLRIITRPNQFKPSQALAMAGSKEVVSALTPGSLFHYMYHLNAIQMNEKCSRSCDLTLHGLKLGRGPEGVTKIIFDVKVDGAVEHSIVTRWLKLCPMSRNIYNKPSSGRSNTCHTEVVM